MGEVGKGCGECGKTVPADVRFGSRCPHCGVLWNRQTGKVKPKSFWCFDGEVLCPSCSRSFREFKQERTCCPLCNRYPEFGPNVVECFDCDQKIPVPTWQDNGNLCPSPKCVRLRELRPKRKELFRALLLGLHGAALFAFLWVFFRMGYTDLELTGADAFVPGAIGFIAGIAWVYIQDVIKQRSPATRGTQ